MKSLDFRLKHELSRGERPADEPVRVVLSFTGKLSAIEALGFTTVSRVGDVATGTIPFGRLGELGDHPGVLLVEGSSSLKDETDLSLPAINLTLPGGGGRTVPSTGRGAVIGVIDSGFDLTHPTFCDASGKTRIIAAWDQTDLLNIQYEGQLIRLEGLPPRGFGYGVEYKRETINEMLARRGRLVIKNDAAAGGHGTQVAGVAAGNGAPDGRFVGVAPEAELVLVAYRNDVPIGGSSFVIDAIAFIVERAAGRRVVINLSQGDNLGAHDGSSLLERTIDWYAAKAGVLFVNSAGNERGQRHHARGRVSRDKEMVVRIEVGATNPIDGDVIDLWYGADDRFDVGLREPGGQLGELVGPNTQRRLKLGEGAEVYIVSETNSPYNGQNRISLVFEKGEGWKPGPRELILRGRIVENGEYHAWADRPNRTTVLTFAEPDDEYTLTLPSTAEGIITVSCFVTRPQENMGLGELALFASRGPTRDGRVLKPDITAPGIFVNAPAIHGTAGPNPGNYQPSFGTSIAAPHVSGLIALLLALRPDISAKQVKDALLSTAKTDETLMGQTPNTSWGHGKLDAGAAYQALSKLKGEIKMSTQNVQVSEFTITIPGADGTTNISVTVTITVEDGNVTGIEGTDGQKSYVGKLSLHPISGGTTEGGDECVICDPVCHVESPCPTKPPEP